MRTNKQAGTIKSLRPFAVLALSLACPTFADTPTLPGVGAAMKEMMAKNEIAGAITIVVGTNKVLHLECTGLADVATQKPMTPDTLFWIASMTKPVTATAVLMLQDEGKLNVADPVEKYLPEFANLKTPSGKAAKLTITHLLTHTSGLGEADGKAAMQASTLADLVPLWLAAPMQYEPGEKWKYTQSGINAAARIVEVVSGMSFDAFLQQRLFNPLGMKDTTFYPTAEQRARIATAYAKNKDTGALEPVPPRSGYEGTRKRPPQGNGGLYSSASDYARFCQMLLNNGTLDGRCYLSTAAMKCITVPQTGDLETGFFQKESWGSHYGWGLGTCILRKPHEGVASMLSPGSFGHGGAWGTQAWIDPVKGVAYVLMVQRANFPNSDNSDVRKAFQQAAAKALAGTTIMRDLELVAGGGTAVEGQPPTQCKLSQPFGIAFDPQDNMYICEETSRILRIDAKTGILTIMSQARPKDAPLGDGKPACEASFVAPHNLVADAQGNLFIADTYHYSVRRVDAKTGIVTTFAGNGAKQLSGDGGPAASAGLDGIACLCFSSDYSQLYLGGFSKAIRVVNLRTGLIETVSGIGPSRAQAVDSKGNLFIPTRLGLRMRSPDGKAVVLDDPTATPPLKGVKHLWADRDDNILIADAGNHLIRKFIVRDCKMVTLAGTGDKGASGVPGPALQAQLGEPHGVVTHPRTGDIYIADSRNHRVLKLSVK